MATLTLTIKPSRVADALAAVLHGNPKPENSTLTDQQHAQAVMRRRFASDLQRWHKSRLAQEAPAPSPDDFLD